MKRPEYNDFYNKEWPDQEKHESDYSNAIHEYVDYLEDLLKQFMELDVIDCDAPPGESDELKILKEKVKCIKTNTAQ